MKFLWYEELKKNQKAVVEDLCSFLGYPLSEEKIKLLMEHTSIGNLRKVAVESVEDDGEKEQAKQFFRCVLTIGELSSIGWFLVPCAGRARSGTGRTTSTRRPWPSGTGGSPTTWRAPTSRTTSPRRPA